MNIKVIRLLSLKIFSLVFCLHGDTRFDQCMNWFGKSFLVSTINQLWCDPAPLNTPELSDQIKNMGKEAQRNLGISESVMVPTVIDPSMEGAAAIACGKYIALSPYSFSPQLNIPYGIQRCDLHHEAVHIKYHDWTASNVAQGIVMVALPLVLSYRAPSNYKALRYAFRSALALVAGPATQKAYMRYAEKRADKKGHEAVKCYTCLEEKIIDIEGIPRKSCYLTSEDLQLIADKQKSQNQLCSYHQSF